MKLLEIKNIVKEYDDNVAVDGINKENMRRTFLYVDYFRSVV